MGLAGDTTESGPYPIVLVSYHLYCPEYDSQATAGLAKAFGEYAISEDGQQTATDAAGSAPMSETLRTAAQEALDQITVTD